MATSLSEQLEEGEIIDEEDDFEAISDNSIPESTFGKFVSPNENLRALSLSSDSDIEIKHLKYKRKIHRKCKLKRKEKRFRASSESDSDFSPPNYLKGKLKEAIRISDSDETRKNTLERRLKGMGGLATNSECVPDDDKTDDAELENLRMEALKTAVLNKFQRRKRKKLEMQEVKPSENKENTPEEVEEKDKRPESTNDLEEDEDVLRASLLACLSKKITKKDVSAPPPAIEQQPLPTPTLPKQPVQKFPNKIVNKRTVKIVNHMRPKPQVKPLIINVNSDSDSEEEMPKEITATIAPPTKVPDIKAITNNVEKFLKEQRAKFETETQKQVHKENSLLEKSAVKLLPKSQQIEYQLLLKRLRNAERKMKMKNIELKKMNESALKKKQAIVEKKNEEIQASSNASEARKPAITNELTTLQRTLKEIKMQRNGSLQIKSKYQMLTPIIRKITATSNDRKKQENRIKQLLQELKEARNNLSKSHEKFSALVKDLVLNKEKIDESSKNEKTEVQPVTSTPIKNKNDDEVVSPIVTNSTNNDWEDMDVCNSDETDVYQIDIVDPNDIDQIFKRKPIVKSTIPEYVSPLNYNACEKYGNVDPLGIMCPYEINGSCRDIDCTFKHYMKNHDR